MAARRHKLISVATQVVAVVLLLAAAGGVYFALWRTRPGPDMAGEPPAPRRVEVMLAHPVPVRRQWHGFGTARARDEADVPAEVSAVVIEIPPGIVEGAALGRGEVVARLDDTDFVAEKAMAGGRIDDLNARLAELDLEQESWQRRLELAVEDVRLAEDDYERVRSAFARDAARQREVDQARQRLVAAMRVEVAAREELSKIDPRRARLEALRAEQRAALRRATKNVERCTIRSPLAGRIDAVDVEAGESLAPGQRVARVVNLQRIEVPLRLPAGARPTVLVGDEVTLSAEGASVQTWDGQVRRIGPTDDQSTRTMTVYAEVEQDPGEPDALVPGRFVRGTVVSQTAELRYVVPRRSLLGDRLLVVEEGRVRSRPVRVAYHVPGDYGQLGVVAEQWAVLADPLAEGTAVVVNAARSLSDGLPVRPVSLNGRALSDAEAGAGS